MFSRKILIFKFLEYTFLEFLCINYLRLSCPILLSTLKLMFRTDILNFDNAYRDLVFPRYCSDNSFETSLFKRDFLVLCNMHDIGKSFEIPFVKNILDFCFGPLGTVTFEYSSVTGLHMQIKGFRNFSKTCNTTCLVNYKTTKLAVMFSVNKFSL